MHTSRLNCHGHLKTAQALVYKGYVILLENYDSSWSWSSDFSQGCSPCKEEALKSAQLHIEEILLKRGQKQQQNS